MEPGDEALVRACRRFVAPAWEALVLRYQRLIYAIARRGGLGKEQCAEVFQNVFAALVFNADDLDLDLRLTPAGGGWVVAGQVLGSSQGGEVELHGPHGDAWAPLNQLCEFRLSPVPSGVYTLTLHLDEIDLEIAEIDVGG